MGHDLRPIPDGAVGGAAPSSRSVRGAAPPRPVTLDGAVTKGSKTAKVAMIEYSEFECPFCARFTADTLPELERASIDTGKVLLAFRHMPLASIHPSAVLAAEGAECAGRQGKFWEMHNRLFQLPKPFTVESLRNQAVGLGLEEARFGACMTGESRDKVQQDLAGAKALRLTGTPTFLIGPLQADGQVKVTQLISGARPFSHFSTVLDGVLRTAEAGSQ